MRQRQSNPNNCTTRTGSHQTNVAIEISCHHPLNNTNQALTNSSRYKNEKQTTTTSSKAQRRRRGRHKKLSFTPRTKVTVFLSTVALVLLIYFIYIVVYQRPRLRLFLQRTFAYPLQAFVIDPVAPVLYKVVDLPEGQHDKLLDDLETNRNRNDPFTNSRYKQPVLYGPVRLVRLSRAIEGDLREAMRPIMEDFCQCELQQESMVHGIRLYQNGSSVIRHVDLPDKWVVSATVHIQSAYPNVEWPITLQTGWEWLLGRPGTSFVHKPGQVVLYQGSRTWHYRQGPYQGGDEDYAAAFLGYLPKDYPKGTGWPTQLIHAFFQLFHRYRLL